MKFELDVLCACISSCSATYFVEYVLPAALLNNGASSHVQSHLKDTTQIACRKMKDGSECVIFTNVKPIQ